MKALFLDRDGVINQDLGYISKIDDFIFNNEIFPLLEKAKNKDYLIIIVTNQSGISRGFFSEDEFNKVDRWMKKKFKEKKIIIDKTYYCPHHPTEGKKPYRLSCNCRKPKPGMFLQAKNEFNINMKDSFMIGDKESDLIAAESSGIENNFLLCDNLPDVDRNSRFKKIKTVLDIYEIL